MRQIDFGEIRAHQRAINAITRTRNKNIRTYIIISSVLLTVLGASAHAEIISITGDVTGIDPPSSVVANTNLESNESIFLFQESRSAPLTTDVSVDVLNSGSYGPEEDEVDFPQGVVGDGTLVDSYFIHADPVGSSGSVETYSGTITFKRDVLGLLFTAETLASTHDLLGSSDTNYDNAGLNIFTGSDQFSLSPNRRVLTLDLTTATSADHMRVVTSAVPLPSAYVLFASAFLSLMIPTLRARYGRAKEASLKRH